MTPAFRKGCQHSFRHLLQKLRIGDQLFLAGTGTRYFDRREGALVKVLTGGVDANALQRPKRPYAESTRK